MPFLSPPPSPILSQIQQLAPLIGIVLAAPLIATVLKSGRRRRRNPKASSPHRSAATDPKPKMTALQRAEAGNFSKKRLFNNSELRIFRILEAEISAAALPLRVMGQTSMRGFIETDSRWVGRGSFFAINDQRMDFVVADGEGNVVLAVEFNGAGHFRGNVEERDARKAFALEKSGISFLTIEAGEEESVTRRRIRSGLGIVDPA